MACAPAHAGSQTAGASSPPSHILGEEEVRTIIVLGFPVDVKVRELQNLLRWWPGYESSQINFKGDQPMGFALFSTTASAMAARNALQNLIFDAKSQSVLRAEMAKKNLFVKRGVSDLPSYDGIKPNGRGESVLMFPPYALPPATPTTLMAMHCLPWPPPSYPPPNCLFDPYLQAQSSYTSSMTSMATSPSGYAPVQNTKDNPPCNTLFIGNLGESTNEAEIRGLFENQPSFRQMKILRQHNGPICFVEFAVSASTCALTSNQHVSHRSDVALVLPVTPQSTLPAPSLAFKS
eukprot:SM000165S02191  [mRNA]  locus=s165:73145:75570:- [translate_table: standard]